MAIVYQKIPKSSIIEAERRKNIEKWQQIWTNFFPSVKDRLMIQIPMTNNFTTMVTGHGPIRSYYYRVRILESPGCPCSGAEQTIQHLLWECSLLDQQRRKFKMETRSEDNWPINYGEIIKKHLRAFLAFVNSIDFVKL